ncbi:hypothetical protein, partial [uncultured Helicobacter sp.]|uniref:hypothetical protein n=1 Tax=uncultured Helicobacter sp. TaxID=175537 RepID=UPI0026158136
QSRRDLISQRAIALEDKRIHLCSVAYEQSSYPLANPARAKLKLRFIYHTHEVLIHTCKVRF